MVHDTSSHFIGSLAPLLRKDYLEFSALDNKAIHFVTGFARHGIRGVLDKGKPFGLLGVKVARNVCEGRKKVK
jgi:hypothetical protein